MTAAYPDLSEAAAAHQLTAQIQSNPDLARKAADKVAVQLGAMYMTLAENALRQNQTQEAAGFLDKVLLVCPGSAMAQAAQQRLDQQQPGLAGLPPLPKVRSQTPQ